MINIYRMECVMLEVCKKIYNYVWDTKTREFLLYWGKVMLSWKGIWFFLPVLVGTLITYWFLYNGCYDSEATIKPAMESIAVWIIGSAVAVFFVRLILYKQHLDLLLFLMAINFCCREIHFAGTNEAVIVVIVIVFLLFLKWKNIILDTVKDADWFLVVLGSLLFTYLFAFLVQRDFFAHVLPILPDEDAISEGLEEVMENIGHLLFLVLGVVAFFSIKKKEKTLK
jgi:hypothetical protein